MILIKKKKKKGVVFTREIETDRETDRTVHGKTLSYRQPYDDFGFIPFEISLEGTLEALESRPGILTIL